MSRTSTDITTRRMRSATERACSAHTSVTRAAERLAFELDEVTANESIPLEIDPEDSAVIAVVNARAAYEK